MSPAATPPNADRIKEMLVAFRSDAEILKAIPGCTPEHIAYFRSSRQVADSLEKARMAVISHLPIRSEAWRVQQFYKIATDPEAPPGAKLQAIKAVQQMSEKGEAGGYWEKAAG